MSRKTIAFVLLALAMAGPLAAERVALVIGNGAYGGEVSPLRNPGNDARAVAGKLRGLGFAVVQGLDLDEDAFWSKVEEFAAKTKGAEAALLFYAGHGVQVDGENYLIPVDAGSLESKADLRRATLKLDDVLEMMAGRKNLVFLDACRNNPLGRGLRSWGNGRGLAAVSVESLGREFLIAYAAAKGQTAADGAGGNSPYTQALLKHLGTPGESVEDMLTKVTRDVAALTGRKQIPWRNSSLEDFFYFAPRVVVPTPPVLKAGERFRDCAACPEMVVIPAGSFLMGSPESEEGRAYREGPQQRVEIREAFAVGVYEVTFEEWDACAAEVGCGGYRPEDKGWGRGRRPVINVSWRDAQAYVRWLSRKTGNEYRLLSEAEWEYAARAGSRTRYSFGDEITPGDANYGGNIGKTQRVGSYRVNGYGLYDMHGNVLEMVQDCYNDYRGAPNNGGAWERGDCSLRLVRGGSWNIDSRFLRSASRSVTRPGDRGGSSITGFRVARTLKP